ncbi:aminoglycoside phosphotransferase family protein [Chengkuizengella axinellae]|uniref:Aminoglycoside phosphotransferase family protein n=1 Tax=Chengkuizengella axinellae TaxID=3064388 RepID=A0ABT9J5I9_9BACL|nr:aminoglycoside phosphotransferase family protein [Chengkuizengella sp. 2205SS18-9]MDP5276722.1 aminoglycoside phosphotransferase family protein [Chengkuizengella sp. 2205SS18-9]
MNNKEELTGGRIGKIHKLGETVVRPSNIWTKDVHSFLNYLHEEGADFVPKPYGINEKNEEILSFMTGDVYNYPLPEALLTDSMIVSSSKLLLKFHKYSERYVSKLTNDEQWMLPATNPAEVMCHGDYAPYNVTIVNNEAAGIIDFDTLHPGPRMWDIAYAIYRWVPFDSHGNLKEQIRKAKLFLDTYGVDSEGRSSMVKVLVKRLQSLTDFMRSEARNGNKDFQLHIEKGHLQLYQNDIDYLKTNEHEIIQGISNG